MSRAQRSFLVEPQRIILQNKYYNMSIDIPQGSTDNQAFLLIEHLIEVFNNNFNLKTSPTLSNRIFDEWKKQNNLEG